MKLLVLAQVPPPHHGQSAMVQLMLDQLSVVAPDVEIHHVNLALSQSTADIGRWRWGKVLAVVGALIRVWSLTLIHGRMSLYYLPAPGKRAALYRDIFIMLGTRIITRELILHWHATGLGGWLKSEGHGWERILAKWALGRAQKSIVLGEALRADAEVFVPKSIRVLRNGIEDPCPNKSHSSRKPTQPLRALFLGLCSTEKGVLAAAEGINEANHRHPGSFSLTVAGEFDTTETHEEFLRTQSKSAGSIEHVGFVKSDLKQKLFEDHDVLMLPTHYPHEAHPLVIVEALAHDLPIIVTDWNAVAEGLPESTPQIVVIPSRDPSVLADALQTVANSPKSDGRLRQHFLQHYRAEEFARNLADIIR
ncbi:glycosyltransferase family 4 protein [Opitutaceae bacterium]|nr:glycosyltransferase family 4 protein [Opitutaceae bacterium]